MTTTRKKLLDKIRAMLNTEGRTEAEMMAFLAKARELMATYDIDESELQVNREAEGAKVYKGDLSDPYEIKKCLAVPVGKFTRCRVWNGKAQNYGISFCGLESDVIFAQWLLETLQRFIMRALRDYQGNRSKLHLPNSRFTSASFVAGCAMRIAEKLKELTPEEPKGSGLVLSRKALIDAELARNGIVLSRGGRDNRTADPFAAAAGMKAGDGARFDRPVSSGGQLRLR